MITIIHRQVVENQQVRGRGKKLSKRDRELLDLVRERARLGWGDLELMCRGLFGVNVAGLNRSECIRLRGLIQADVNRRVIEGGL